MDSEMITSVHNKRLKSVSRLRKRRNRNLQNRTIVEGYRAIASAVENDYPLEELWYCTPLLLGEREDLLIRRVCSMGAQTTEISRDAFCRISGGGRPQGLIAVAPIARRLLDSQSLPSGGLYLIAESIEKPGNLGSIIRSADGVGASAVIVCNPRADVYDPKCVSSSMGSVFSIPLLEASIERTLSWCHQNGTCVLAATPHADMIHTKANMKRGVAIAIGNEQFGLSEAWINGSNAHIRIPMLGQADSLNVAAAATVLLYEAVRQKSEHLKYGAGNDNRS